LQLRMASWKVISPIGSLSPKNWRGVASVYVSLQHVAALSVAVVRCSAGLGMSALFVW
jgi:hypothetical protein